jgi:hypothetical protein
MHRRLTSTLSLIYFKKGQVMKKTKIYSLLLTTVLSGNIFATELFDIKFTPNDFDKDPTFNCSLNGEDRGSFLTPTLITITASGNISVMGANDNNGRSISNIRAENLSKLYFTVTHHHNLNSDAYIFVNTNNETRVTCSHGTANRLKYKTL